MTLNLAGEALLPWLLTYSIHSAVLGALGFLAARLWLAPGARRSAVLKVALFGALFSASMPWKAVSPMEVMGKEPASVQRTALAPTAASPAMSGEVVPPSAHGASASAALALGPGQAPSVRSLSWKRALMALLASASLLLVVRLALQRRRFMASLQRELLGDAQMSEELAAWAKETNARVALSGSTCLAAPVVLSSTEICVPLGCWEHLCPEGRKALLAHEFAHIERRDPLWFTAAAIAERIFFFLPWHRALRQRLNASAEVACDALAAKRVGSRSEVARCLAAVAAWSQGLDEQATVPAFIPAMAANQSELVDRVRHLLHDDDRPPSRRFVTTAAASFVAFACCTPALTTRSPEAAPFDDAAIIIDIADGSKASASRSAAYTPLDALELDLAERPMRQRLRAWLVDAARELPRRPHGEGSVPIRVVDEPILIRGDLTTPMKYIQQIMEMCGDQAVSMPNVRVHSAGADYEMPLPVDLGPLGEKLHNRLYLRIDRSTTGCTYEFGLDTGSRAPRVPQPEEEVEDDRALAVEAPEPVIVTDLSALRYLLIKRVAHSRPLHVTIDARSGVTLGAVTEVMDLLEEFNAASTTFVGSYER